MAPERKRSLYTSSPERTLSLPNRDLALDHKHFAVHTAGDLAVIGHFEKQRQRLDQIGSRLFNGGALARVIDFRAKRHEPAVFSFDDRRQAPRVLQTPSLLVRWRERG